MNVKSIFLFFFFSILITLNILVGMYMVDFFSPIAIFAFFIIQLINILVAYRLSELIMSLISKKKDLPKLKELNSIPPVALLYVTYNDAMIEPLARLKTQTYKNYDIFVLDDSTDKKYSELIYSFDYEVIRRDERIGFKAGALNNWLSLHEDKYEYFIILDSDSLLDADFIGKMVEYAEHPSNKNIAIFQGKWRIWNTNNKFPRIIATLLPLWLYSFEKLANEYDTPLIMGHNNLFRTKLIKAVNGFDERFVCEDLATTLNLLEKGYECKYADVISYEACPENVKSYAKRYIRWAKGTIEVAKQGTRDISFTANLHLFMTAFSYLIYFFYLPGMLIATWGYSSSLEDALYLLKLIFSGEIVHTWLFAPLLLISFYVINFVFLKLPLAYKLKISTKDYFLGMILTPAIDFYMLLPLVKSQIETIFGKKVTFDVTDKKRYNVSLYHTFREMKYGVFLWVALLIGVIRNPITFIFNFFWLIPFMVSPLAIYIVQKTTHAP
jgi:cellulose synthase/poly-beta-1,6-N-acetylglucosamine synthase-like glycosyltransferase